MLIEFFFFFWYVMDTVTHSMGDTGSSSIRSLDFKTVSIVLFFLTESFSPSLLEWLLFDCSASRLGSIHTPFSSGVT